METDWVKGMDICVGSSWKPKLKMISPSRFGAGAQTNEFLPVQCFKIVVLLVPDSVDHYHTFIRHTQWYWLRDSVMAGFFAFHSRYSTFYWFAFVLQGLEDSDSMCLHGEGLSDDRAVVQASRDILMLWDWNTLIRQTRIWIVLCSCSIEGWKIYYCWLRVSALSCAAISIYILRGHQCNQASAMG